MARAPLSLNDSLRLSSVLEGMSRRAVPEIADTESAAYWQEMLAGAEEDVKAAAANLDAVVAQYATAIDTLSGAIASRARIAAKVAALGRRRCA